MSIIISSMEVANKPVFHYLWLVQVTGVDLSQHCLKCFKKGAYHSEININRLSYENIELADGVYYLCKGKNPVRCKENSETFKDWNEHFHLAFRFCEGETLVCEENGIKIVIKNAERLPISPEFIDWSLVSDENKKDYKYWTCRNLHFAHWYAKEYSSKK